MEASKSLRRPGNWQDFETLCKKLWGEVWNCPEIKKNGRNGQSQNGVDIYGMPKGENQFYGIQCKGKDEYSDKQFTKEEIIDEIEKAKSFQPQLKKLYFTTTALKDVKIESFVRNKNIENLKINLFEVHLFCWEDIVDLIDENRATHDWYVNSRKFKLHKEIQITFSNDSNVVEGKSIFLKPFLRGITGMRARDSNDFNLFDYMDVGKHTPKLKARTKLNLSYFPIKIKLHNTGSESIEDFKILLDFEGEVKDIANTNRSSDFQIPSMYTELYIDSKEKKVSIVPRNTVLVIDDTFCSQEVFIKPGHNTDKIIVKWKLLSKEFKKEGKLIINIKTAFEILEKEVNVPNSSPRLNAYGEIEDFIVIQ